MKKIINFFKSENQINPGIEYYGIAKYMPLIICGGFYLITILLFIFGPFDWGIINEMELYTFLFLALFALVGGYLLGSKIKLKKTKSNFNINHIIYFVFGIFLILYILNSYAKTKELFPNVIRGILDSGKAYQISHGEYNSFAIIMAYVGIILSPITSFLTPLFFVYYKNLSKTSKILGIIALVLNLCSGIAQGVINAYAILAFQVVMFLLIYIFSNIKNKSFGQIASLICVIIAIGSSFLLYYKVVMGNRLINDTKSESNTTIVEKEEEKDNNTENNKEDNKENNKKADEEIINDVDAMNVMFEGSAEYITQAKLKKNHIFNLLPNSIIGSLNHIISYITHGYKGLSFALQKDFTSTYGLGFSDFFRHNLLKVVGKTEIENDIYAKTYMAKILNNGWATGAVWSTFFIYPASDIGFPLTLVLVYFIGMVFSLAWRDTLESKNIFATVLFMNLCMIICFFCANNVYLQNGGPFLTICFMSLMWIISKKLGKEV